MKIKIISALGAAALVIGVATVGHADPINSTGASPLKKQLIHTDTTPLAGVHIGNGELYDGRKARGNGGSYDGSIVGNDGGDSEPFNG